LSKLINVVFFYLTFLKNPELEQSTLF